MTGYLTEVQERAAYRATVAAKVARVKVVQERARLVKEAMAAKQPATDQVVQVAEPIMRAEELKVRPLPVEVEAPLAITTGMGTARQMGPIRVG